jgi:hypothetical protein
MVTPRFRGDGCNNVFYVGTNADGEGENPWNIFGYDNNAGHSGSLHPCSDWIGITRGDDNPTAVSAFWTDNPPNRHLVVTTRSGAVQQWLETNAGGPWYRLDLGSF